MDSRSSSRSSSALRPLDEVEKPPALVLAQGPRLHEPNDVPHLRLVLLVVNLELVPPANVLAVRRVLDEALDRDHDRLLHRVAHDSSRQHLPLAALGGGFLLRHALTSP